MRRSPLPCAPNSGLSTSGPPGASRSTRARAASANSIVQVGGVGKPARVSRKLVMDLSTQRSMARASFQTTTPSSANACNTPSRLVTASNDPAASVRTCTASGNRDPKKGNASPLGLRVSKSHAGEIDPGDTRANSGERRLHLARVPIALVADEENGGAIAGARSRISRRTHRAIRDGWPPRENSPRFRSQ